MRSTHWPRVLLGAGILGALAFSGAALVVPAHAAQTHWQPQVEAGVEHNTNRNLAVDPDLEADVTGYIATAEILYSYVTPRTETRVRPRLRIQNYPDEDDVDTTELFLDVNTTHQATERTGYELVARFSRQDAFRTELGEAEFDEFDPGDPTEGGDGTAVTGADTRTRAQLRPGFSHRFSELMGVALRGTAETVRFDSDFDQRRDYDYYELHASLTRQHTPRTVYFGGPIFARYETRDGSNQTDDYGFELAMTHEWSELSRIGAGTFVRRSDIDIVREGSIGTETQTNYGFEVNVLHRTEQGRIRLSLGRTLRPSSGGALTATDELRLQYDHDFSARVSMRTAVRAYTQESVGELAGGGSDRDYARGEFSLTRMLTPTMYVRGSYQYTWRDREQDATSADNHAVMVSVGYRGLARPR